MEADKNLLDNELDIDNDIRSYLLDTAKWTKFIAIFMFIMIGLVVVAIFTGGHDFVRGLGKGFSRYGGLTSDEGGVVLGMLVFMAVLFALLYYFLFNFSIKVRSALQVENTEDLNKGLGSLKLYFILWGIFSAFLLLASFWTLTKLL